MLPKIYGHHLVVTDAIADYATRKFGNLDHFLADIQEVRVELKHEHTRKVDDRNAVIATVRAAGKTLHVEERHNDLYAAIDRASDKLERQVRRLHDRLVDRRHGDRKHHRHDPVIDVENESLD